MPTSTPTTAPECIEQASRTRYSACRIHGRITAHGVTYNYDRKRDVLIREDLWPAYLQLKKQGAFDEPSRQPRR